MAKKKTTKKRTTKMERMRLAAEARLKVCKHIDAAHQELTKVLDYLKKIPGSETGRGKTRRALDQVEKLLDHCG